MMKLLNKLNGWQRLWFVSTTPVIMFVFTDSRLARYLFKSNYDYSWGHAEQDFYSHLAPVIGISMAVYVGGLVVAWIRRGFLSSKPQQDN